MGRGGWLAVSGMSVAGTVGLGVWTWFLAGQSLDLKDQWSSVASGFGTFASLVVAVIALVVAVRAPGGAGTTARAGRRSFRARDAYGARVTLGDNSPINK